MDDGEVLAEDVERSLSWLGHVASESVVLF